MMKSAIGDIFPSIASVDFERHVRTRLIGTNFRRRDIGGERVGELLERMANSCLPFDI